jgi:hypothetical protein
MQGTGTRAIAVAIEQVTAPAHAMNITPVQCFNNGIKLEASKIIVESVRDNLYDHVIFKYTLLTENGQQAGESTVALTGEYYSEWDASADGAYQIVCDYIGLELI